MKKTEFILCHGRDVTLVFEQHKKALWSKKPSRPRICIYEICTHVYTYIRNLLLPQPRTLHGPDGSKGQVYNKRVLKCPQKHDFPIWEISMYTWGNPFGIRMIFPYGIPEREYIYIYPVEYMHDFPIRPRMKKLHSVRQRTSRFNDCCTMSDLRKKKVGDVRSQKKSENPTRKQWKLWSDSCGARLAPGLKPLLRLPRARTGR